MFTVILRFAATVAPVTMNLLVMVRDGLAMASAAELLMVGQPLTDAAV